MDWVQIVSILGAGIGGGFGVKLIERFFDWKKSRLHSDGKKDTQLMKAYDTLIEKLQDRVDTLEKDMKLLYAAHTECLQASAKYQAKVVELEAWKTKMENGH